MLSLAYRFKDARRPLLAALLLLVPASMADADDGECTLRVGWEEWRPYIYAYDGEFFGSEYRLLERNARNAQCALDMVDVPWRRALAMLSRKQLDVLYSAGYSDERAGYANFSIPYREEEVVLAKNRKKNIIDFPLTSLRGWLISIQGSGESNVIGAIRGNFYGPNINQIIEYKKNAERVRFFRDDQQMIDTLKAGRINAYLIEKGIYRDHQRRTGDGLIHLAITEHEPTPLHYMFSKAVDQSVIERFDASIRAAHASARDVSD